MAEDDTTNSQASQNSGKGKAGWRDGGTCTRGANGDGAPGCGRGDDKVAATAVPDLVPAWIVYALVG